MATMEQVETEPSKFEENLISIGDVAKLFGIPAYTIRYWEKEFTPYLTPPRTIGKQRRYGEDQIEKLKNIFHMLKDDGYSIAGAKRVLAKQNQVSNLALQNENAIAPAVAEKIITLIREQLRGNNSSVA